MKLDKTKKVIITVAVISALVFFSLGTLIRLTVAVNDIIYFASGDNLYKGTMWRIDQSHYVIWVNNKDAKGIFLRLNSTLPLSNASQCYFVQIGIQTGIGIGLNFTEIPLNIYDRLDCEAESSHV